MRGTMVVVAALAAWSQAVPASRAAEPVRLRYRFEVGDRIDMDVAHRALTETTINGATQTF